MDIEMEDYPKGFFGTGNWDDVSEHMRLFGVQMTMFGNGAPALGVSRKDDLADPETAAQRKAVQLGRWARSNQKRATNPEQRKRRQEWERKNYEKIRNSPEKLAKRAEYARKSYAQRKAAKVAG